jgi:hypothetical protein
MTDPSPIAFYTVTNRSYYPGTIATISSIRTFHPKSPIWVVAECRAPLTAEQIEHLRALPGVHFLKATDIPIGRVKEGWQMKAHAAHFLSTQFAGVLVQVDSDAVLCTNLEPLASEALERGVPVGGKDGAGAAYALKEYSPYYALCDSQLSPGDHFNAHYISSCVLLLPTKALAAIFPLWTIGVDEARFGPPARERKIYEGFGDQGVLNAILFFKGITPLTRDNETISEHWTHGRSPVEFRAGCFWNGDRQQLAFHSVGDAPKFWTAGYRDYVSSRPNLKEVYLYWLFQLFDGPCGLLATHTWQQAERQRRTLFPEDGPNLFEEYAKRRNPQFSRVMQTYGRMNARTDPLPLFERRTSANVICICVFNGYIDVRADVHYFYSGVKRLQNYRALGGQADAVIFANESAASEFLNGNLLALMHHYGIRLVILPPTHLQKLFMDVGVDIESVRIGSIAGIEKGQREGRYTPRLNGDYNVFAALEVYLGRFLLIDEFVQQWGYERCALIDADGGRYTFHEGDIPAGMHVDALWDFTQFTDFVFQETLTGKTEMHQVTEQGLRQLFDLRRDDEFLPMFQASGQMVQGTRAALHKFAQVLTEEVIRQYALGYFPGDEQVLTVLAMRSKLWPSLGAIIGQSLRRQLEVIKGTEPPWPKPFYLRRGEDKYSRHFLPPPPLEGRYAVCLCGFDEKSKRHYAQAAWMRAKEYREILQGRMDVHLYTNASDLPSLPGLTIHLGTPEELATTWDARATFENLLAIHREACADPSRHKDKTLVKRPELSQGMISKLMAVERTINLGYDGVLSADADGDQFSAETIGCLDRRHIDGIWAALQHYPMLAYIVGTSADNSFNTWLSVLREISGVPTHNRGPIDWIWGPCWMIEAKFSTRFFHHARMTLKTILDRRIAFHDEHILNCTYNLPEFADDPLRGLRDLGEAAQIGYREFNPKGLICYQRWLSDAPHSGRKTRARMPYDKPEFSYRT